MNLTILFIVTLIIIIAVYDVWVIWKHGKFESVSAHIIRFSRKMPLVVLLFGIVLGHLFWSMDTFDSMEHDKLVKRCQILIHKTRPLDE